MGVQWNLTVSLLFISLMTNNVEHLFMCVFAIDIHSLVTCQASDCTSLCFCSVEQRIVTVPSSWGFCESLPPQYPVCPPPPLPTEPYRQDLHTCSFVSPFLEGTSPHSGTHSHIRQFHSPPAVETRDRHQSRGILVWVPRDCF